VTLGRVEQSERELEVGTKLGAPLLALVPGSQDR